MSHHRTKRILFVLSSAGDAPGGGWSLPEVAHPYWKLRDTFDIDFASPKGPNPPATKASLDQFNDDKESQKFLQDPTAKQKLGSAKPLSEVKSADYDAVYYPGGHGPLFDLASNPISVKLANEFYHDNKIIAAVSHGLAALVEVRDKYSGHIFADRDVCGFSNEEEEMTDLSKDLPFAVETKIKELGGRYIRSDEPWEECVRIDGRLITGQNPASARALGEAILEILG